MADTHTESAFEASIVDHLVEHGGYLKGDPNLFDRERAIFAEDVIGFIKETQPQLWETLSKQHGFDDRAQDDDRARQASPLIWNGRSSIILRCFNFIVIPFRWSRQSNGRGGQNDG
jgi:hypothetical protein